MPYKSGYNWGSVFSVRTVEPRRITAEPVLSKPGKNRKTRNGSCPRLRETPSVALRNLYLLPHFVLFPDSNPQRTFSEAVASLGSTTLTLFPSLIETGTFFRCLGHVNIPSGLGNPVSCFSSTTEYRHKKKDAEFVG